MKIKIFQLNLALSWCLLVEVLSSIGLRIIGLSGIFLRRSIWGGNDDAVCNACVIVPHEVLVAALVNGRKHIQVVVVGHVIWLQSIVGALGVCLQS